MEYKFIRVRVSEELYTRYKIICAKKNLSIPKQFSELVRCFVEIQEENERRLNKGN